jgi:hypothetical protein
MNRIVAIAPGNMLSEEPQREDVTLSYGHIPPPPE